MQIKMKLTAQTVHRVSTCAGLALIVLVLAVALALASSADAAHHSGSRSKVKLESYRPPHGKIYHGVSDTGDAADLGTFRTQVGAHPAVMQDFFHWGIPLTTGALQRWQLTQTRGVLSLSTAPGGQPEVITPKQIANGRDDHYMLRLGESIAASKQVVYIRLMPEMNGSWNPYSAFNANGSSRGRDHSTTYFKRAWQRFALIVKGGMRRTINRRLRKAHMPRIYRARSDRDPVYRRNGVPGSLPRPSVSMLWVPQTSGSPNLKGNRPAAYWPGRRYVDWVGADVYSKFSNATLWHNLNRLYGSYRRIPFLIGEYSPWDADARGAFTRRLFGWARRHDRTRMLIYYRSVSPDNVFNIQFYPAARRVLRSVLNGRRFLAKAPEYRR